MRETDRPTLLIVDDEPMALDALQQALQRRFDVLPAHSGPEALELLRCRPVQVLVTDQRLPGMSGVQVLAAARAERPGVTRVMLADPADFQELAAAVNLGGVEFCVTKPWGVDELIEVLERAAAIARPAEKEIAERRQAEEALQETAANYRRLLDNSITGISQALPEGHLVYANDAYAHMYGYSSPEAMIAEVSDIGQQLYANPEDRAEVLRVLREKGAMGPREMAVARRDGTQFYVLVEVRAIRDSQGNLRFYQAEHIDVTERRRAEAALQESEEKYRSLFEGSLDATFLTAPDGRIFAANPAACRMFGYTEEEFRQLGRGAVVDASDPRLASALEERTRSGRFRGELTLIRNDCTKFPAEVSTALFTDKGGGVKTSTVIRDMTERKRAELALEESQTLLNSIINSTSDLIWSVEAPSFELLTFNQAFCDYSLQVLGVRAKTGMLPSDLLPTAELAQTWLALYQRALKEGAYTTDYELQTSRRTLLLSINVLEREGAVFGISVFAHDITERKLAEAALRENQERYRSLFEYSPISLWEEDFSGAKSYLDELRRQGVTDLEAFLAAHPEAIAEATRRIRILSSSRNGLSMVYLVPTKETNHHAQACA